MTIFADGSKTESNSSRKDAVDNQDPILYSNLWERKEKQDFLLFFCLHILRIDFLKARRLHLNLWHLKKAFEHRFVSKAEVTSKFCDMKKGREVIAWSLK